MLDRTYKQLLNWSIFSILFIISIQFVFSQESGWIEKDGYLEQKLQIGAITFIKYSNDGKYFYTFSEDSTFRKWLTLAGTLIEETKFPYKVRSIAISPDETMLAVSSIKNNKYDKTDSVVILKMADKTLITSIDTEPLFDPPLYGGFNIFNKIIFLNDSILSIASDIKFWDQDGYNEKGRLSIWNIQTAGIKKKFHTIGLQNAKVSEDMNFIATVGYSHSCDAFGYETYYHSENTNISLYNSINDTLLEFWSDSKSGSENPENNISYEPMKYRMYDVFIDKESKHLYGKYNNGVLYEWDIQTKVLIDSVFLPMHSLNFINSNDLAVISKYNSSESKIDLYKMDTFSIIKNIFSSNEIIQFVFAVKNENQPIIAAGSDGVIRMFNLEAMEVTDHSKKDTQTSIFPNPNPGFGKIRFTTGQPGDIKIKLHSMTGNELAIIYNSWLLEGDHEIPFNETDLAPGMYFYTINIDGKFLNSGKIVIIK